MKAIVFLIIIFFCSNLYSQSLWQIDVTMNPIDTSKEYLKSIILNEYSSQIDYEIAAFYLAYHYRESEKQWLLDNLNTLPINDKSTPVYIMKFQKFVTDQIVKGYLGDQSALTNLQTAIDSMNYIIDKIIADRYLTEAGVYNNYDLIKSAFLDTNYREYALQGLRTYANSPIYRDEVSSLFEQAIINSTNADEVAGYAGDLFSIDKELTITLLDQKFEEFTGWNRQSLFIDLYRFDPNNQPRRSMWAIPLEPDEDLRAYYIPFFPSIKSGLLPKVYLQPFWINFLRNWYELESSDNIKNDITWFLNDFRPLPSSDELTDSIDESIRKLSEQVDSMLSYTWLADLQFKNELQDLLQSARTDLQSGDSLNCRAEVNSFQDSVDNVYKDSLNADPRFVTLEGWKFLHWNAQYILDRLPEPQTNPNLLVNLKNSQGTQIPASNVKYYDTSWKDATDNGDGTFTVITTKPNVSVRLFYEYASQTVNNVPAQNNTYTFHTVNTEVELENSSGQLIDEGTVKYYAGAWRDFGTTVNGVASKELLPNNYSFRMTYEYGSIDKQQNLSTNSIVDFTTVLCTVKVSDTQNQPLNNANVKYYGGAWRNLGLTNAEGTATKELLPMNISFRASYGNVSQDKQQDIGVNSLVEIVLNVGQ